MAGFDATGKALCLRMGRLFLWGKRMVFGLMQIYSSLGKMSVDELTDLGQQLKFHPDPWAVGARKLVAQELRNANRQRNKVYSF
jgi:hypothetical protein